MSLVVDGGAAAATAAATATTTATATATTATAAGDGSGGGGSSVTVHHTKTRRDTCLQALRSLRESVLVPRAHARFECEHGR